MYSRSFNAEYMKVLACLQERIPPLLKKYTEGVSVKQKMPSPIKRSHKMTSNLPIHMLYEYFNINIAPTY
jgi:hypothetical protein